MNIIVDVAYLISRIYTNFRAFPCKKCDVGYYVVNHDDDWWLPASVDCGYKAHRRALCLQWLSDDLDQ